jgi:hypothetical protein
MQNLQFRYSQEVNRAPGFTGALFGGRFKSKLVLDESHWFYLLMYIHLNPVRARLVSHPDRYTWTSHGAYQNDKKRPKWLLTKEMQEYFDTDGGYDTLLKSAMDGSWPAPPDFDNVLFESRRGARQMLVKQEETQPSLSATSALVQVSELTGVDETEILSIKRGPGGNPARVLAVWWLVYGAGQTNNQVGEILKMSPSAVSKILKKLNNSSKRYLDGVVGYWQDILKNNSQ